MKCSLSLILMLAIAMAATAQPNEIIRKEIYKIRATPVWYKKGYQSDPAVKDRNTLITDSAYLKIVRLDSAALRYLIPFLTDTTATVVSCECLSSKCTIADIAFFLINDIEGVPVGIVCHMQYDVFGNGCGNLPDYFLENMVAQRSRFQKDYTAYFYGAERRKLLHWLYEKRPRKKRKNA
jgi:hypothetical protein